MQPKPTCLRPSLVDIQVFKMLLDYLEDLGSNCQSNVNPLLTPKYRLKKFSQIKENNST